MAIVADSGGDVEGPKLAETGLKSTERVESIV
jgi:hypothetical protein